MTKKETVRGKSSATGNGADQRVHERHDLPAGVLEIEVELHGYQRDGREFHRTHRPRAPGRKFRTPGVTSNLSLSGMLAHVTDELTVGSQTVRLPLSRFRQMNASLNLQSLASIAFEFSVQSPGKLGFDDIEFSR